MRDILAGIFFLLILVGCGREKTVSSAGKDPAENLVRHAKGLSIYKYDGYSVVKVTQPWPNAQKDYTYILKEKSGIVPDSLKSYETISVPVKKIIVTSTTHIPSLEMLGVENTLTGFPGLSYISSEKVRKLIDQNKIRELGSNQAMNTEVVIDLQPDVIIGYGINNNNPTLDNLEKSGLKIMLNGDWNEETPLGKAEWIKFFGAIYGQSEKAASIFSNIEKEYNKTLELAKKAPAKPTVLIGGIFENRWNLPRGKSWGALFINDAGGRYLWSDIPGTASLSLPFEAVLEKAKNADLWIAPGQYSSLAEMASANAHYGEFDAFRNGNVFSFKKGKTGGYIYYELAPNRPDLVLKDMLKILHPELLANYELFFFQKLN
jgi:iron complex transport system substrate-binding protein